MTTTSFINSYTLNNLHARIVCEIGNGNKLSNRVTGNPNERLTLLEVNNNSYAKEHKDEVGSVSEVISSPLYKTHEFQLATLNDVA